MISINDIREAVGLSPDKDTEVLLLRNAVIAQFERATSMVWNTQASSSVVRRSSTPTQQFYIHGVNVDVTEVKEWDYSEANDGEVLVKSSADEIGSYDLFASEKWARIDRIAGRWDRYVKLTFTAGVDSLGDEFADVRRALIEQAQYVVRRFSEEKLIMNSQAFEGGSTQYLKVGTCHSFMEAVRRHKRKF